jgi:hypothetical protein
MNMGTSSHDKMLILLSIFPGDRTNWPSTQAVRPSVDDWKVS